MGVSECLSRADEVCSARGQRLTSHQRRVLEIIAASAAPLGAYTILERFAEGGRLPTPPTIYRALDFLCANGLVHRVETRNAYVACDHPEAEHSAHLLLCGACGRTVELLMPELGRRLRRAATRTGFVPGRMTVEVEGLCRECRPVAVAHA